MKYIVKAKIYNDLGYNKVIHIVNANSEQEAKDKLWDYYSTKLQSENDNLINIEYQFVGEEII